MPSGPDSLIHAARFPIDAIVILYALALGPATRIDAAGRKVRVDRRNLAAVCLRRSSAVRKWKRWFLCRALARELHPWLLLFVPLYLVVLPITTYNRLFTYGYPLWKNLIVAPIALVLFLIGLYGLWGLRRSVGIVFGRFMMRQDLCPACGYPVSPVEGTGGSMQRCAECGGNWKPGQYEIEIEEEE